MRKHKQDKGLCLVVPFNHFDLLWRRCWDRDFEHDGQCFVSYRKCQQYAIEDALRLCQQGEFTYNVESAFILRAYLDTHPEQLPLIRQLAREGRFDVEGGGETIVDSNLGGGETTLRNFVMGTLWTEEVLGIHQPVATVRDSFGQCAQLPQILRGCEFVLVTDAGYGDCEGPYFRGLDGSTILNVSTSDGPAMGTGARLDPDPVTLGKPTAGNHFRGVVENRVILDGRLEPKHQNLPLMVLHVSSEEGLPHPDTSRYIASMRKKYPRYEFRFGLHRELAVLLKDKIAITDNPPATLVSKKVEANPAAGGVAATRIELKRRHRRCENSLLAVEKLCAAGFLRVGRYDQDLLASTWRRLFLAQFHDAVTATHIDPAYSELMDNYAAIEESADALLAAASADLGEKDATTVSVFNPHSFGVTEVVALPLPDGCRNARVRDDRGHDLPVCEVRDGQAMAVVPDLAPLDTTRLVVHGDRREPKPARATMHRAMENEFYRVECDDKGVTRVFDKLAKRDVCDTRFHRVGELILEEDVGECWSTLSKRKDRWSLAPYTRHIRTETGASVQRMIFETDGTCMEERRFVYRLRCAVEVSLYKGLRRVDFRTTVDWDAYDRRLRMVFPTAMPGDWRGIGYYEVPYGHLRRARYEQTEQGRVNKSGDWTAYGWGAVVTEHWDPLALTRSIERGVAVVNTGTPSYRVEDANIFVTLARSPNLPTFLHDERYHSNLYEGMRDKGRHCYHHALTSFEGELAESHVSRLAASMNQSPVILPGRLDRLDLPRLNAQGTAISAIKKAEQGNDLVVRLWECRGLGETVVLSLPQGSSSATLTNFLERRPRNLAVGRGRVTFEIKPFQIVTVKIRRKR